EYLESTSETSAQDWYANLEGYTFETYVPDDGVVYTGLAPTVRDSSPRSKQTFVSFESITAQESVLTPGGGILAATVKVQSFYRMTDETAIAWLFSSGSFEGTPEQLVAEQPIL